MTSRWGRFLWVLPALLLPLSSWAQGFGRNRVRIRNFEWKVTSTEHFDIHYYDGSEPMVPLAARVLERSYARLSKDLKTGWDSKHRKPFFLYATADEMQQTSIAAIGPGTGGVTEAFKDRFMVFHDGSKAWLDTVTTHELTHVFQFHMLLSGFWKSGRILKTIVYPLWMMEGMAEYYSWGLDEASGEIIVRDAATSDGLIPLWKLEKFSHLKPHQVRLAYESGEKVLRFLEREYGEGIVARLLKMFENRFETSSVLQELIGLDVFQFDKKWQEYAKERYGRFVRKHKLQEPSHYGEPLTEASGKLPEQNTSPVFTPDGHHMAWLSTKNGYPSGVFLKNLKTGKTKALVDLDGDVEQLHVGNFTNKSRALAISPDGLTLTFAGTKNHRPYIFLYDLGRRKLNRIPIKGLQAISGPTFSPDGLQLAFTGMKHGVTNIYLMDRATREYRAVTDDPQDDQTPNFSPDGRSIVYSSEIEMPGDGRMLYQRRLYRVHLQDGSTERLLDIPGAARDPVHSADGKRVLFALEFDGFYEAYELDLATRKAFRLTRSIGAAYTPIYDPAGEIAFAGFRRGSIHIFRGARSRFEPEPYSPELQLREKPFPTVELVAGPPERTPGEDYKPSFSTDLFLPAFFFSTQGGVFWTSYWQGSDMLGNHQVLSFLSYGSGSGFLNYQNVYQNSKYRTQFQVGAVGRVRRELFDETNNLTSNEFTHTEFAGASYPLDLFHRFDFQIASSEDSRRYIDIDDNQRRVARTGSVAFVRDTVRGRYLWATSGNRLRAGYVNSARVIGGNFVYQGVTVEGHQYIPTGEQTALVLRGLSIKTWGNNTPQLILGGVGGVRGYARSTVRDVGSRMALATAEWRVPLLSNLDYYMWYIFPDFYFKAISFAAFTDAGRTWDTRREGNLTQIGDIRHSYGAGLRLHTFILQLFPLTLHFDYAQRSTSNGGVFYVYLGPLF